MPRWIAVALAVALVAQTLRLWWRGARVRRRLRAQQTRAALGEAEAEPLLAARGYDVCARQATRTFTVQVDGEPREVTLRADYLVERGGRRLVADVKTGRLAPRVESAATRRQLLEYRLAFDVDGVLLVDVAAGAVQEIVFPLAPTGRWRWLAAGLLVGATLGWLSAWAVRTPAASGPRSSSPPQRRR
jgi:hypothetical protein